MATQDAITKKFTELRQAHVKEFTGALHTFQTQKSEHQSTADAKEKRQLSTLALAGIKEDQIAREDQQQEKDLDAFLAKARPALVSRAGAHTADAQHREIRSAPLTELKQLVVPAHGASVLAQDITAFDLNGQTGSGWIFPDDPSMIKVHAQSRGRGTGWGATAGPPPPQANIYFTFTPVKLASYSLTAIFAFHGFYVVRADDGWLTHKFAKVNLHVAMNVHQYVDLGWKSFPSPISVDESNINKVETYDRTHFFDYTAVLKQGDPVTVTVQLTFETAASGSGSYAELNFDAGTANHIDPLFLSVGPS